MKILQVLAGAEQGGAETAFVDTCVAMKEAAQDIVVVTRKNSSRVTRLRAAGIPVYTLPFGGRIDLYTKWKIYRLIKKIQPEIIQTWMSRAAQKTPKWTAMMGIPRYLVVSRLGGYYKIKNFHSADYFTTITPDIRRYLIENGVDSTRVLHVNNFAETEPDFKKLYKDDFGIKSNEITALSLGRLHNSKAFDFLIRCVSDIENLHLLIAGEGPERASLEALIGERGLQARVHLLGWRSDRAALFDLADLCIFPSRYEPFGTVFVQAWANNTPLVTTDSAGPRQFVRDGEDGLLVPIDNREAMVAAVRRIIQEPDLRQKLVENGRQRYLQEFTKEKTLMAYLTYFNEIRTREGLGPAG